MTVKIYTTSTCPYCEQAKEYFKQHKVEYEEINVEDNPQAQKEMIEKSGQMGVPVIDVNGKIIIGFDRAEIDKALKQ